MIGVRPLQHVRSSSRASPPDCTRSLAAPVVDTVGASALAALAVASLVGASQSGRDTCETNETADEDWCLDLDFTGALLTTAAVAGLGTLLYGSSAAYGYTRVTECRDASK